MALTYTPQIDTQFHCPDFTLPGVDGKTYSRSDFEGSKALLVLFICNHCPYVKAIEDRIIELGHFMKSEQLKMVALSSNDSKSYPEDSFEKLKARWIEKEYPFPYLHDETQNTAKLFGAVCTPDFFLFDKNLKLVYRGRLDDSWKEPDKVTRQELKDAIIALTKNLPITMEQIPSMGCSIKWIKS